MGTKVTVSDLWTCSRCDITSADESGRMCPCPRGSCEAEPTGKVVSATIILVGGKDVDVTRYLKEHKLD